MNSSDDYEGITLFAAIKTFYESGNDILSAVCCLVLVTITDGEDIDAIKTHFHDKYNVMMPHAVLQTILKRLKRNGFITHAGLFKDIQRTLEGKNEASRLSSSVDGLKRDFAALIKDLGDYFQQKGYLPLEAPEKTLLDFIDENLGYASLALTSPDRKKVNNDASHIAEYIVHVEKNEPSVFVLLQNIFFGRLYLSMIRTRTEYNANVRMEPAEVYLDTSILMSLLGLHEKEDCDQAKELLEILKNASNIEVCIFSETVEEAQRLLESYQADSVNLTNNIRVNTIHSVLKRRGYDKYRVGLLLESLEDRIGELGLKIKNLPFTAETQDFHDIRSNIKTWSELLENPKGQKTLDHDANVLYAISFIRNGVRSKLFEKCRAVFVTPDRAIHELSKELASKNGRFPLSMLPLDIVSMLWMRDIGNAQIATSVLRQSVMAYVREKAISHKLWDTFISALKDAQGQERLTRDDIALILASDDVSRLLAEKQYDAPRQILDPKFVQGLRNKNDQLVEEAKRGGNLEEHLKTRLLRMSHLFATTLTHTLFAGTVFILAFLLYFLVTSLGVDRVASIVGVGLFAIPLIFVALTGREFKVNALLVRWRKSLYAKLHAVAYARFEAYFVDSKSAEPEVITNQAD